jgi:putative copper resistance protein D
MTLFQFLVLARWVHFCAEFVLFGSSFFWFYMGREASSAGAGGLPHTLRATKILLRIAAFVAAISGLAWLIGILANITDGFSGVADPENLRLFFFETPFGPVAIVRLTLLAAGVAVALLPSRNRAWLAAFLAIGALLLINQAWLGHAAEGGASLDGALMILAYGFHMLAAAAWVGGLAPLLFALIEQRRREPHEARAGSLAILLRYSLMGMVAVTLIILSGIANAAFHVAGSKLFHSAYGEVLLAKLGLVTAMLALAYFNRFVALPRLRAAPAKGTALIAKLRTSVGIELALGVLIVGVAAVLGITPPPQ